MYFKKMLEEISGADKPLDKVFILVMMIVPLLLLGIGIFGVINLYITKKFPVTMMNQLMYCGFAAVGVLLIIFEAVFYKNR